MTEVSIVGSTYGDPNSVNTYSGVPFYLFNELESLGMLHHRVRCDLHRPADVLKGIVDLRRTLKFRRLKRNAYWRYLPKNIAILSRRIQKEFGPKTQNCSVLQFGVAGIPRISGAFVAHVEFSVAAAAGEPSFANSYGFASGGHQVLERAKEGEKLFLSQCDLVWTNSPWTLNTFKWAGLPANKFWVHPPACNIADPGIQERDWSTPHILFVGKDWLRKGGAVVLDAFRMIRCKQPQARLTIVGCDPCISEPGVQILGFLDKQEPKDAVRLEKAFREATVFCMPSLWESVGLVYMEAALYGLPLIMLDGQSRTEIFPDQMAVHLQKGSANEVAEAILALANNRNRSKQMGIWGREHVLSNYTWQIVTRRLLEQLCKVLEKDCGT